MTVSERHASEDNQEKITHFPVKNEVEEVHSATSNLKYDRYLELHRQFKGLGEKKLLRKRMFPSPGLRTVYPIFVD
jgi:hypothetical protein